MKRQVRQQGFTLIELVVVLVILGILAAFAIPRFIDINTDARESSIRGLSGTLRSAAALVHGLALARNATSAVQLEGQNVDLVNGYPAASATGIGQALVNLDGFDETAGSGTITWKPRGYSDAGNSCNVVYTEATASAPAVVTLPSTVNCS